MLWKRRLLLKTQEISHEISSTNGHGRTGRTSAHLSIYEAFQTEHKQRHWSWSSQEFSLGHWVHGGRMVLEFETESWQPRSSEHGHQLHEQSWRTEKQSKYPVKGLKSQGSLLPKFNDVPISKKEGSSINIILIQLMKGNLYYVIGKPKSHQKVN